MCLEAITSVHAAQFASFTSTTGMPPRVHPTGLGYVYVIYMARLANEAATIRRVLEPLFQNFDANNHWSLEKGVAYPVLTFLQSLLEETGCIWNLMHHLFRLCAYVVLDTLDCNSHNLL
jgi:hypothetical protein